MTTKQAVLTALFQDKTYCSGQQLCDQLQISRTAVWKVMQQLREEGYEIESAPNRGYRLVKAPDLMTAEQVSSCLHTVWAGKEILYFPVIGSTNNEIRRLAEEGAEHGLLAVADRQEGGKGRRGRSWGTPPGEGIAMSLLVRPKDLPPERASMMTLVMGLALASACSKCYGLDVRIKWPNDIVAEGRKISGTLTEMSCDPDQINYLVIGTGINVRQREFPEEIRQTAISLSMLMGDQEEKLYRAELIAACLEEFERYYALFMQTQSMELLREEYNSLLAGKDQAVRVLEPGNEYTGTSRGINAMGELLVEKEDGEFTAVYAGEVSVRGIYGYV